MNTTRYLVTDHEAHIAAIQDWTFNDEDEVIDVTDVEIFNLHDALDNAAIAAAKAAGYDVDPAPVGANNDLGAVFEMTSRG